MVQVYADETARIKYTAEAGDQRKGRGALPMGAVGEEPMDIDSFAEGPEAKVASAEFKKLRQTVEAADAPGEPSKPDKTLKSYEATADPNQSMAKQFGTAEELRPSAGRLAAAVVAVGGHQWPLRRNSSRLGGGNVQQSG